MEKMNENKYIGLIINSNMYQETSGRDNRIAIRKFQDVISTLTDASSSLTYASKEEYEKYDHETLYVRRLHIRHAINDLNSALDLLCQVPWFYYRLWNTPNTEIKRNSDGWVGKIECKCDKEKVLKKLNNPDKKSSEYKLYSALSKFKNEYTDNKNNLTVRALSNNMKHNKTLEIAELCNKLKLNIFSTDAGILKVAAIFEIPYKSSNKQDVEKVGSLVIRGATDDKVIDFCYQNSEIFRGVDSSYNSDAFSIEEIYDCCIKYYNAFLDLLTVFIDEIYNEIPKLNMKVTIKKGEGIDLNKYLRLR